MGVDLVPRNRAVDLPHYNWSGWRTLDNLTSVELAGSNDGDYLSAADCRAIAQDIETQASDYNNAFAGDYYGPNPALEHAKAFRECRGCWQW